MSTATAKKPAKTKKQPAAQQQAATTGQGQAMFFNNPQPLDITRHAEAGLKQNVGFEFTRSANSVMISVHEFPEIARSYPIVFSNEEIPKPIAVMSMSQENSFIDAKGQWDAQHYVPAYIRKYPFGLFKVPDSDRFLLCVDEDAPHYMEKKPEMPFYDQGEPAQLCKDALEFCGAYQKQHEVTEIFGRALRDANLLEEKRVQVDRPNGETLSLGGFTMINEQRWQEFAKDNIVEWQQKGYAGLVALALNSQVNWKYLALRG